MLLAELRDLVIVIFGVLGIVAIIVFVSLALAFFRKVAPILDSAKETFNTAHTTTSLVSNAIAKPTIKIVSFASGLRKAAEVMMRLSNRKGGGKGE